MGTRFFKDDECIDYYEDDDISKALSIVERLKKLRGKWHRKEVDDREFVEQVIEELQKLEGEKKC